MNPTLCFRFLGLGLLVIGLGCNGQEPAPAAKSTNPQTSPSYSTANPQRRTLRHVFEQPGFVEPFEETPLVARIAGYMQKVHVDIGDRVKGPRFDSQGKQIEPGQVLAELWVPEMEEELRQKQALVTQAQAEVEQAQAALAAAEANIATHKAAISEAEAGQARADASFKRWQSEYKRIQDLVARKLIDEQTRDETHNQYESAKAARQEASAKVESCKAAVRESEAKRDKANADVAAAKARVGVARADEARLNAMLQYSRICAPFDGVVTRRHIHTGHYLQPGTNPAPVFVIARTDRVRLVIDIPEHEAMYVEPGVAVGVRLPVLIAVDLEAKVTRTSWSLDARARTLRCEVDVANGQGTLRPGMYAAVTFTAELPNRLTVPNSAITKVNDVPCIFQVQDGKAVRTPVQLGLRDGQFSEIVKKQCKQQKTGPLTWESITGDEQILNGNLASITDGQSVNLTAPKSN